MLTPSEITPEMLDAFNGVMVDIGDPPVELYALSTAISAALNVPGVSKKIHDNFEAMHEEAAAMRIAESDSNEDYF